MVKRRPMFEPLERRLCMAGPTLQTTFSLPVGSWTPSVYRASPIFYDIFGTGKDDLITVASGAQIIAYAENADGSATPVVTYHVPNGVADIKSTPIVVVNPLTGEKDLFAAMGRDESNTAPIEDNRVFGWDLQTGNILPGWTLGASMGRNSLGQSGSYGALTSGALEGNGMPDIVVTSFSEQVTALRLDGSTLWQFDNNDTILSGAVIADIDRDGKPEVIVGGDSSASPYFQQGGWVNVLSNTGALKWRRQILGEVTWSSPVVADLTNSGYLDVVIGTGVNFSFTQGTASTEAGDYIYAFDPFGNTLPGWPYHTTFTGDTQGHEVSAALAADDLLGNGQIDIVALDRAGYVHVIQPNGTDLPGFEGGKRAVPEVNQSVLPDDYASPSIADINGDGKPDIIVTSGPFLRAFDTSGNLISIASAPIGAEGLVEGYDIAPAIGNFDGTGGLTMATITYDPLASNRPDRVQIYRMPVSTLAPPWPMIRRVASSDAVERSATFDTRYVASVFNAFTGSAPDAGTIQQYAGALNLDLVNLLTVSQLIGASTPVRQTIITRFYQSFFGHAPDANAVNYWSTYLNTHTDRQFEVLLTTSSEFTQFAGNSTAREVTILYQAILKRSPSQGDVNNWVSSNLSISTIAGIIVNSPEAITLQFNTAVLAAFGSPTLAALPAATVPTFTYDYHGGVSEELMISNLLASNVNYAATNFVAGYIANLYRDILLRQPSSAEVASWLSGVDSGAVGLNNAASLFLSSQEARQDYIQAEYLGLLGHFADQGTINNLINYPNRESIVIFLVGSAEYYARAGATNAGFIAAAFRDVGGITASQDVISSFEAKMAAGLTTAGVAQQIIYTGSLYYMYTSINQLMFYIPDYSQGVLRIGQLPESDPSQPVNPSPSLINYLVGLYQSGATDEQIISFLLNSPQYFSRVFYYGYLYRMAGVRN